MSDVQVFPAAASARRAISRRAYILFGAGAFLLACGATAVSVLFASTTPTTLPLALAIGVSCLGAAGLVAGIATLARMREAIQVEVTPYHLIWREGKRIATLEYEEVVRIDLVKGREPKRGGFVLYYPVVRFVENDGEMMEFEVTFEDRGMEHRSRFDAWAITSAALQYLPQQVVLSPALEEFIRTGEVDLDLLPER